MTEALIDPAKSHFDRFLRPILASRFITVSAIIHLIIILLFGGRALFNKYVEPPDFVSTGDSMVSTDAPPAPPPPPPASTLPPTATAPSTSAPPPLPAPSMTALATMNPSQNSFSVPMPQMAPPTIAPALTQSTAPSTSTATVALPGAMAGRGEGGRASTGQKYGERPAAEQAVLRALRWLQSQQHTDGTWGSGNHEAFTGLALLCFLGHGETPLGSHEFGGVVTKAIDALVSEGNSHDGRFGGVATSFDTQPAAYEHGICTYALCEAYTMTKDQRIEPLIRKAVDYIIKGQRPDGGWAYKYDLSPDTAGEKMIKSDTSVSGWQVQALKAAHLTGLSGMDDVIQTLNSAMKNMDRVFDPKDGSFGYRKPGDRGAKHTLTGVGVLAKLFWLGRPDRTVRAGLKDIQTGDLNYHAPECSLYAWYYDTQACYQAQGSAWDWWNSRFQDLLTSQQSQDGSWPPTGGQGEPGGYAVVAGGDGPLYRTTLCCLMLEVFYRYLPTSQQDALGASKVDGL